jgi:hypothetical protein
MKKIAYHIIFAFIVLGITACEDKWTEHYVNVPDTIDQSVWEAMKADNQTNKFVELIESSGLDSIFEYNDVHTFFVPSNSALESYTDTAEITKKGLAYHILHHYIQPNNIERKRKIQTLMLKFAQFEKRDGQYLFDEIPVTFSSPLYRDGRYFIISEVASPKPSLYEYIAQTNPALKQFIDDQDSIILDKELSKPLGFDDYGNTIYDSVVTVINLFEEEYFKVSEEFRVKTATLVFPRQHLYEQALTNMALKLGGSYDSYDDIALEWQQDILIPYLLKEGIYENMLEPEEFDTDTLKNILGDSIRIRFTPVDKTICSNGYAYNYAEFEILDSLFMSPLRTEGEALLNVIGKDRYSWKDSIKVISSQTFLPDADFVADASNDSIMKIQFPNGYEEAYSVEFKSKPLFPRRYLFVIRTHMDFGGLYEIYVNDELVKTFDYYDFIRYRGIMPSAVSGKRYVPQGRFNKFDFWVDNITEYGRAKIRLEYKGPSQAKFNGLFIDYIGYFPEAMTDLIIKNP